ncbi:hypothetical protein KEM48_011715 [Puccinia striiformis f. sp. tritici PST-130]|nr:hypothetical protein KEM48_011715 [Puccinia striiformis f. sp. tritici PST-130]
MTSENIDRKNLSWWEGSNVGSSGQSSFPSSTDSPSHIGPVGQALINIHNPVPASHDSDFVNTYTGMYTKEAEQPSIASLSPRCNTQMLKSFY